MTFSGRTSVILFICQVFYLICQYFSCNINFKTYRAGNFYPVLMLKRHIYNYTALMFQGFACHMLLEPTKVLCVHVHPSAKQVGTRERRPQSDKTASPRRPTRKARARAPSISQPYTSTRPQGTSDHMQRPAPGVALFNP